MAGAVSPVEGDPAAGSSGSDGGGVVDPAAADRFWLYRSHCPRLARPKIDGSGREWVADTRVFAIDMAAVAAIAARAIADDLPAVVYTTRRGIPYVVLPGGWLDAVADEDGGAWGFAVATHSYVWWLVANRTDASAGGGAPAIVVPGCVVRPDGTAELGEEYKAWAL